MAARQSNVVITLRRSTVVRAGVVAAALAALCIGFALGLAISTPSPSTHNVVVAASTYSPGAAAGGTPALPAALPCRPRSTPERRPTLIYIGCASRAVSLTNVTWSAWGTTSGSGSGTLSLNDCEPACATGSVTSSPAFVVVSEPVAGVFQHVVITPPSGRAAPQSSSQPGSGWGSG
jgi:hypothetical protein